MTRKEIATRLRTILAREDIESDSLVVRKLSAQHGEDIEVLLEHTSLMVTDLRFQLKATTRELFQIRHLLEEE